MKSAKFPVLWTPRALEILDSVGIANYILENGQQHHKFYTYKGGQSTGSYALWANETSKFQSCVALSLEQVKHRMLQILNNEYNVCVEYEKELIDLDDEITATVFHDGVTEQVQCQYLIGADGVHSYIRQRLGRLRVLML